jgi:hypothetical protein
MRIPSTRGLGNLQQLDRAVREQSHGNASPMLENVEMLIKSQDLINPNLSNADHNRYVRRHTIDFLI